MDMVCVHLGFVEHNVLCQTIRVYLDLLVWFPRGFVYVHLPIWFYVTNYFEFGLTQNADVVSDCSSVHVFRISGHLLHAVIFHVKSVVKGHGTHMEHV